MWVPITLRIALAAQLVPLAGLATAASYTAPTPGTILRLGQDCSPRDWLVVYTDSTRWKLRVRQFDEVGLAGLRSSAAAVQPPDPLPWTQVERISVLRSRRTSGVLLGLLVGGVGATAAARSGDFFIAGALGGGLLGGVLGGKAVHEEDLYRGTLRGREAGPEAASPAPARPAVASDSAAIAGLDRAEEPPATKRAAHSAIRLAPPSEEVDRIGLRLRPRDLLRITGGGTTRYGYVGAVSASGLARFRPERSMERSAERVELIPWERIEGIDRRAGSAGSGAKHGALALGAGGVLLGIAAGAAVDALGGGGSSGPAMAAGGAIGGLSLGALGGLLGAGVGAAVPRWEPVFVRR